eukprot:4527357-Pleurochrysis_carterae.AAC.2
MGCISSKPVPPLLNNVGTPQAGDGGASAAHSNATDDHTVTSRRRSQPHVEADMKVLLSRLEKLDEEKHMLTEHMRRLQASELKESGTGIDEVQATQTRMRFSRTMGIEEVKGAAAPASTHVGSNSKHKDRRSSATVQGRISAYVRTTRLDHDDTEDRPSNVNDLIDMVLRGRQRAKLLKRDPEPTRAYPSPRPAYILSQSGTCALQAMRSQRWSYSCHEAACMSRPNTVRQCVSQSFLCFSPDQIRVCQPHGAHRPPCFPAGSSTLAWCGWRCVPRRAPDARLLLGCRGEGVVRATRRGRRESEEKRSGERVAERGSGRWRVGWGREGKREAQKGGGGERGEGEVEGAEEKRHASLSRPLTRRGCARLCAYAGPIQFGIPPETIKDAMLLGLEVPSIFVVPKARGARPFSLRSPPPVRHRAQLACELPPLILVIATP